MSGGEHVGRQSDSLTETPELTVARSSAARLARVQKASGTVHRGGGTTGNGTECPNPEPGATHGKMHFTPGSQRQYCPNQSHDGIWSKEVHHPPTRAFWPVNTDELKQAIAEWQEEHRG